MDEAKTDRDGEPGIRPVRRPMNAFLIFCKRHRSLVREQNQQLDNRSVTRILGELWANLPADDKARYISSAKQYKEEFMKLNPEYRWYNPEKHTAARSAKPATRPSNAFIVYHGEKPHSLQTGITPGKLADPSCMGGLSLLLMAGEQTLHSPGHDSNTSGRDSHILGHDSQTPGHDLQKSGHDSQKPGHHSQTPGHDSQIPGCDSQKPCHDSQKPGRDSHKPGRDSHKPGSDSQTPGRELQTPDDHSRPPGHDSQVTRLDSKAKGYKLQSQSAINEPMANVGTGMTHLRKACKKNAALLQLAEMCTSRLIDNINEDRVEQDDGRIAPIRYRVGVTPSGTLKKELLSPQMCRLSARSPAKDSPMDLSNKNHECVFGRQASNKTWRGFAAAANDSRVGVALDLTVPSSKPLFTQLNVPFRQPFAKDKSKPHDDTPVLRPSVCKEIHSCSGNRQKPAAAFTGQNFTISGQNVVDKVLESLYYHMNSQKATGDEAKACNVRTSTTKLKENKHKSSVVAPQKTSLCSEDDRSDAIQSTNRHTSVRSRCARPAEVDGCVRTEYSDLEDNPAMSSTFSVADIKPSMTFGEIQETLIRRAVESPGSLLAGTSRRFSTGSTSLAASLCKSMAGVCRRTVSTSGDQAAAKYDVETSFKKEAGVDALSKPTHDTGDNRKPLTPSDAAQKPLSWQLPLQPNAQYRTVKSWKESHGWSSFRNTMGQGGDGAPCTEDARFDQGSRGRASAAFSPRDDSRSDVRCDRRDGLTEEAALEKTCKGGYYGDSDRLGPHCHSETGDSSLVEEATAEVSPRGIAADYVKEESSTSVKTDQVKSFAQGVGCPSWKAERSEIKTSWEILKDVSKVVPMEVHNEDRGKPLKKRRLKVQELQTGEVFAEHTVSAKKKRRSKSEAILKARPESVDLSRGPSPTRSGDTPSAECNDSLSGGGGLAGVRKSQRSNRGKKYQELMMQGLIQPSRNGSRKQEPGDEQRTKVDCDFVPNARGAVVGSRRNRKRALSEASVGHEDSASKCYKTGSFDLDACIASLPVCDLILAKKSPKPLSGTTCPTTKTALPEVKEDTDLNIVEVRRLTNHQPPGEPSGDTRLSGSRRRKARKFSITHLLESRSSAVASTAETKPAATGCATSPKASSPKSSQYLEDTSNNNQTAPPFSDIILPVTATIATCIIGDVAGSEQHQSLPVGDSMTTNGSSTAIIVT